MNGPLRIIDVHCEGEIGKVVVAGNFDLPGKSVAGKLHHINTVDDSLRRTLTLEPRSAPAGSVNLLLPTTDDAADAAFIVLQADRAHAMSGSNAICVVTALLESGRLTMHEPITTVTLETAVGMVTTSAWCENGKCKNVSLDMTPAFVESLDVPLQTREWGQISLDLCFGGAFYALVDVEQLGLRIERGQAHALARAGMHIKSLLADRVRVQHPEVPEIEGVAYVMFHSREPDGATRTCTTLWPGRVDRSPCGTGSSAHLAALYARGKAKPGDELISRSIIDSEFRVGFRGVTKVAGRDAVSPRISGRAWLYGNQEIFVDPGDPFPTGFALSDTWGPLADNI